MTKIRPQQRPRRARFEHGYTQAPLGDGLTATLNAYGREGWELVAAVNGGKVEKQASVHLFFKREKKGLL